MVATTFTNICGINIQVDRKEIKNLHLAVYPPIGDVRIAAPTNTTEDNIRLAVIDKLGWIKKQKLRFKQQLRQSKRRCISGECHYFLGEPYRLKVVNHDGKPQMKALKSGELRMLIAADADQNAREKLLANWYRQQLRDLIPILVAKWQPIVGIEINECRIRKMKTKWGSCNIEGRRVWLNLELVKKPRACIDYIFLHELTHLIHRCHDESFKKMLKKFMPDWQVHHKALNTSALVHDTWDKT